MIRYGKILILLSLLTTGVFLLTSCSNLPLIGKKEQKVEKLPEGRTVTVEGMERVKGINPSKSETSTSEKQPTQPLAPKKETETQVSSVPTRPFPSSPLPFFQVGFKRKVAILDFENKTTYQEEKIGEAVAKRLSDKLEATQRVVTVDRTVVSEMLNRVGFTFENLSDPAFMKRANQSLGIQAFDLGNGHRCGPSLFQSIGNFR